MPKAQTVFNFLATGAIALLAAGTFANMEAVDNLNTFVKRVATVRYENLTAIKASPSAWPALGQDKTIALAERLQGLTKTSVTIYCSSPDCRDIQHDLDDALQIADWPSDFETGAFMPPEQPGVFVGPAGEKATALAAALSPTFGPVGIIDMRPPTSDVGVMFGKRPRAVSGAFGFN